MNSEQLSREVVDCAYHIHRDLGPGLMESVYETVLAHNLKKRGIPVETGKRVCFHYDGHWFDNGFRVDILVDKSLIVELKSVEKLAKVHSKQLLTYMRLMDVRLGLLINFGSDQFRDGVKRVVNGNADFTSSALRVNTEVPDKQ